MVRDRLLESSFAAALQHAFVQEFTEDAWTLLACYACNTLHGQQSPLELGGWSQAEKRVVLSIRGAVKNMLRHSVDMRADLSAIEKDVKLTRVSYSGEEVKTCHRLSLEQILPSLPPPGHGGSIDLLEFVSPFTRRLLLNPELCLLPDKGQKLPKLQGKIHIVEEDLHAIADLMVERGICCWTPLSEVATYRGEKLLNGLFGVEKSATTPSGKSVLRIIMNLVPSNSVLLQLQGSTKNLPGITSWMSCVAEDDEVIRVWQSDMSNAFYLFRLPDCWARYLSFNVVRNGESLGLKPGISYALSCMVLPMGWLSSVSVMQEISENLLLKYSLSSEHQLARNKSVPLWMVGLLKTAKQSHRTWWHVYLDNFAAGQLVNPSETIVSGNALHDTAEAAWATAHVISAEKKRKSGVLLGEELGGFIAGDSKTLGPSPERLLRLLQATIWILSRPHLSKKQLQVIAGRWVHIMQFRRPAMGFFEAIWEFVGRKQFSLDLVRRVRRELFACVAGAPLMQANLASGVSAFTTASDASHFGGAVGLADSLTDEGKDYLTTSLFSQRNTGVIPVLVISLFNGIGGAFRTYDILGFSPVGLVSFDIHGPANRVCSRRWPHSLQYGDVRSLDRELLWEILLKFPEVRELHLWAGFPCVDLSSAKAGREGLAGAQSSLFYEVVRIIKLLKQECEPTFTVKYATENVASMPKKDLEEISAELETVPFHLNSSDAVPMNRPRLCWTSESLWDAVTGIEIDEEHYWWKVTAKNAYPDQQQWLETGVSWEPGLWGEVLPTAMKAIERKRPPPCPAGLARCDQDTQGRWASDDFKFPPYHYLERFVFWRNGKWRLADSIERELLLGYGYNHTELCYSASDIKGSKKRYENERLSLLGDSFSIYSFVIVAAAMCRNFTPTFSYEHLCSRMGMAPGFRAPWRLRAPLARKLQYGSTCPDQSLSVQDLNRLLLTKVNHTGSDVRISTGEIMVPKAFPRQSIEAEWWHWKPVFKFQWQHKEHINLLELRSILQSVVFTVNHHKLVNYRIFHITDSYVCMSIIGKGRSSSRLLNRTLKILNAYLLAHGLTLVVAHVESSHNPTDGASREA